MANTKMVLSADDKLVYEFIASEARASRLGGLKAPRGYTPERQVVARLSGLRGWNEADVRQRIGNLLRAGVVHHDSAYDYLVPAFNKSLTFNNDGAVIVVTIPE